MKRLFRILAAAAGLGASCGWAQGKAAPPDTFTEALVYARFARESFTCQTISESKMTGPVAEAMKWTQQAIAAAEKYKSPDKQRMMRRDEFLGTQKQDLELYKQVRKDMARAVKQVEPALAAGELSKAEALIPEHGPKCEPRLARLRVMAAERRKLFRALVTEGDRVWRVDRSRALERYRAAAAIDRRDAGVAQKIRLLKRN